MEYCDDDRHYIRVKTNPVQSRETGCTMGSEAMPWMTTPITRQQLQGMSELRKREKLVELVNEDTRAAVFERARSGHTSYLWDVNESWLERKLDEQGWANARVSLDEILEATRALYIDCEVTTTTEYVTVPQRESAQSKRVLRAGLLIDWS